MKKTLVTLISFALVQAAANAQTVTSTAKAEKKSDFVVSVETETKAEPKEKKTELSDGTTSTTKKISGVESKIIPQLGFRFDNDTTLSAHPIVSVGRGEKDTYEADFSYLQLRLIKDKLLTEKEHGVDFKLDTRFYQATSEATRALKGQERIYNVRTTLNKKFTDEFALENHNRVFINELRDAKESHDRLNLDLRLTPSYSFTEQFAAETTLKYENDLKEKFADQKLSLTPGVKYAFNKQYAVGAELEIFAFKTEEVVPAKDTKTPAAPAASVVAKNAEKAVAEAKEHKINGNLGNLKLTPSFEFKPNENIVGKLYIGSPLRKDNGEFIGKDITDNLEYKLELALIAF